MKMKLRAIAAAVVLFTAALVLTAQDDPNPNSPSPVLLTSANTDRALTSASAINGRKYVQPLAVAFVPGGKTRVTVYLNSLPLLPGEGINSLRIYLRQQDGKVIELRGEGLTSVSKDVMSLTFSLVDASEFGRVPTARGDAWLYVTWRGLVSNYVRIGIGRTGGKLPPAPIAATGVSEMPGERYVGYRWSGDRKRFLEQATFGPSTSVDERLRRIGLKTWLAEQFEAPYPYIPMPNPPQMPTNMPSDCQLATNPTCYNDRYTLLPLQQWFFREAFYGDAQLRHRVSWALSQIWVTSGVATQQSSHAIAYHKLLQANSFGNYRQLMTDATLSPTMGNYLDMVRSTKDNPNENFPREILQLFSIGLYMLNQDGTVVTNGQGQPVPTYDQNAINEFSKVMTGWTYCNTCANASPGIVNYKDPMTLVSANHDLTEKHLLSYPGAVNTTVPACSGCTTDAEIRSYATASLDQALDNIFNHPNVGPYIGKLLIQHMVTSDPTPAYIARVAAAFNNNGSGVRGDMKAVIRAILLDPEARGDFKTAPRYGKLREPVQLLTNLGRIFPAKAYNGIDPSDGSLGSRAATMGQNPFYSPTVFNYFMPDHIVPGTTINAPEFELLNTGMAVKRTNFLYLLTFEGITANATDSLRGTSLDYSEFVPYAEIDPTGVQLVDMINLKMMHGTLTPEHKALILTAVQAVSQTDPTLRVKTAVYLVAASSQYQVQK